MSVVIDSSGELSALNNPIDSLHARLDRIETALRNLMGQQNGKEWFSTDEVAAALGKAPFTVREWCRHRRIRAKKRKSGRGNAKEWMISAEELKRIQDEGLLPFP